ncbi:MAG: hypothetical protein M1835_007464 [Candelina submexicana]|nr:MAG: hypothetical protein M1835_007464 [Candelina submexicana]
MPFQFSFLSNLLSDLEAHITRDPPHLPARVKELCKDTILQWFRNHRHRIDSNEIDGVALLSALFPERRTDRVYGLREASLSKVLGRILGLHTTRLPELNAWKQKGRGDLAECVERILEQTPNAKQDDVHSVTIEEVDQALASIAAQSRFSGPKVRANAQSHAADTLEQLLKPIFQRLPSRDAKYFIRMILKDYTPVVLPEALIIQSYHWLLPDFLRIFSSFDAALPVLRNPTIALWKSQPDVKFRRVCRESAAKLLVPTVGVKVGRPTFLKARSIKHCLSMNTVSTIHDCLRVGQKDCKIIRKCILEGELVVFSDKENKVLEFHKLRKHISRSGTRLGTEHDSQPHAHEHLMIIFYDLLLLDDEPILTSAYTERRKRMKSLISRIAGRAAFVMRNEIDFSRPWGGERLRHFFAQGITNRWEGFVLKPCEDPYFSLKDSKCGDYAGCWIKLKQGYIEGLGDTADFAVIGASYNAKEAQTLGLKNISWTTFHLGCLENKEQVIRFGAKPVFQIVNSLNQSINKHDMKALNQLGQFQAIQKGSEEARDAFDVQTEESSSSKPDVLFRKPFVFEVSGFGFDKPSNSAFYTIRFPHVLKIHWDRTFKDTVSFEELQDMAEEARTRPAEHTAQEEERRWVEKLKRADLSAAERRAARDSLFLPPPEPTQTANASKRRSSQRSSDASPIVRIDTSEVLGQESCSTTPATDARSNSLTSLMTPPTSSAPEAGGYSPQSSASSRPMSVLSKAPSKRKASDALGLSSMMRCAKKPKVNISSGLPLSASVHNHPSVTAPVTSTSFKPHTMPLADVTNTSPTHVRRVPPVIMEDMGKKSNCIRPPTNENKAAPDALGLPPDKMPLGQPKELAQDTPREASGTNRGSEADNSKSWDNTQPSGTASSGASIPRGYSNIRRSNSAINDPVQAVSDALYAGQIRCDYGAAECALRNVTFLLGPDVAQMPYVTQDLLPKHVAPSVDDLTLWDRSRGAVAGIHGKQKIVLVESRRGDATADLIHAVLALQLNEKILFYDWRMLEELAELEGRGGDAKGGEWLRDYYTACVESFDDRGGEIRMVGVEGLWDGRYVF